jgi:hypothetical protein
MSELRTVYHHIIIATNSNEKGVGCKEKEQTSSPVRSSLFITSLQHYILCGKHLIGDSLTGVHALLFFSWTSVSYPSFLPVTWIWPSNLMCSNCLINSIPSLILIANMERLTVLANLIATCKLCTPSDP